MSNALQYEVIKNMPVARFAYKGTHSHPVRRTVLLIENTKELCINDFDLENLILNKYTRKKVNN